MRTLTRPMFNMGGPIKQGVMNGIREPKKNGGKMLLVGQHPKEFQDKSGREKHWIPLLGWGATALRAAPAAYRGFKAARTFAPGKLGTWGRIKNIMSPGGKFRNVAGKKGTDPSAAYMKGDFTASAGSPATAGSRLGIWKALRDPTRFGAAIRENPLTALSSLTLPNLIGTAAYKAAPGAAKGAWGLTKRYADAIIPGDQSSWYTPKEPPTGVPLNPNLQANIAAKKELSTEKKKEFALQQREGRVKKYLEMMGYDRSKKTAIADALIDASKIVGDRGTLDKKNIAQELINPIIQATSKRLDKPEQIREAVGLMSVKAAIQKDMEDPTVKALRLEQLKGLRGGFSKDIGDFILSAKGTKVKTEALARYARAKADQHGLDFTVVTDEDIAGVGEGASEDTIIKSVVKDDGVYMIGDAIVQVTDGVPKRIS